MVGQHQNLIGKRVTVVEPDAGGLLGKRGDCVGFENGRYLVVIDGEPFTFAPDDLRAVSPALRHFRRYWRLYALGAVLVAIAVRALLS